MTFDEKFPWGFRWRSSNFFILTVVVIGLFLDLFLYGLIVPVIPFILEDRLHLPQGHIQSAASGLLASHALATLVTAPLVGVAIDGPVTRRSPFLFALVATFGATFMLCFGKTVFQLVVARLLQGASAAIVWIVGLAIVTDTVNPNHLGKALGAVYSITTFGALIAPTVGGLVYTKCGYYPVYLLAGVLICLDIVLRLFMIDKEAARSYLKPAALGSDLSTTPECPDERSGLMNSWDRSVDDGLNSTPTPYHREDSDKTLSPCSILVREFPLLALMSDPRLLAATFVTFTHACFVGMFNATLPIHVQQRFGMSSLDSGLLFIAIELPYMICGPLVGWWIDRGGPRAPAGAGAVLLVPTLFLLRLPRIAPDLPLLVVLLALSGVGLSATSSSAFVQANKIGREQHSLKPGLFGSKGPYGQLYALNNMLYSLGMTLGPLLAGGLRDAFGYGNAMAFMAAQAAITSAIAITWMEK